MPLPASVSLVPVTGTYTYRDATGTHPGSARVVFVSLSRDIAADAEVTLPAKLVATLTADGEIPAGFELPTLADTAREIDGVYYRVTEDFPGGRAPFEIFVASDATAIDMSTVAPVVPVDELVDTRGPKGNTLFATFDIDPATGELSVTTPVGFSGIAFVIDGDGYLGVTIQ